MISGIADGSAAMDSPEKKKGGSDGGAAAVMRAERNGGSLCRAGVKMRGKERKQRDLSAPYMDRQSDGGKSEAKWRSRKEECNMFRW